MENNMEYPATKSCTGPCGQEKELTEFANKKDGKYGRASQCKECSNAKKKARYYNDPDYSRAQKERAKKWRLENPERYQENQRIWHHEHMDELVAKKRELRTYDDNYRLAENTAARNRYAKNPDYSRGFSNAYNAAHPDKVSAANARYRALKNNALVADKTEPTHELVLLRDGSACCNCNIEMNVSPWYGRNNEKRPMNHLTVEHLIPLKRGGKHIMENAQAWCLRCNLKKGSLTIFEFRSGVRPKLAERGDVGMDHPFDF